MQLSIDQIRNVALLSAFTDDELRSLAQMGRLLKYEPYTSIVIEGESTWGMYLIVQGQVGIYKVNKLSGNVYDVGQLQAGSFFGEMSLVDSLPRSASVQSLTECTLLLIGKEEFQQFLGSAPERKMRFLEGCIQQLVGRLRTLNDDYVVSQYQLWQKALKTGKEAA